MSDDYINQQWEELTNENSIQREEVYRLRELVKKLENEIAQQLLAKTSNRKVRNAEGYQSCP